MRTNKNLHKAKKAKCDEFYTLYKTIEDELQYYTESLKGKIIYSNCDDYRFSNFKHYFVQNFERLQLKMYICTNYTNNGNGSYVYIFDGKNESIERLKGLGAYDSDECIDYIKQADVIVTNPPFSKYRHYIQFLIDYNKDFILLSSVNSICYKDIFVKYVTGKINIGYNFNKSTKFYRDRSLRTAKYVNIGWQTNLPYDDTTKKHLIPHKKYNSVDYPHYDNVNAINVDKTADIPVDYDGYMGVPVTALTYIDRNVYDVICVMAGFEIDADILQQIGYIDTGHNYKCAINDKEKYYRIIIKIKR